MDGYPLVSKRAVFWGSMILREGAYNMDKQVGWKFTVFRKKSSRYTAQGHHTEKNTLLNACRVFYKERILANGSCICLGLRGHWPKGGLK
jgi:hypothetical protein